MMDRRIPELALLLILAIMGCIFAAAFDRWLFCSIFWVGGHVGDFHHGPSAQARLRLAARLGVAGGVRVST
jgi:hypothetical protein